MKTKEKTTTRKQTYSIKEENIEALFLWNVETREGFSGIINRLIEENCPKEILEQARRNVRKMEEENND